MISDFIPFGKENAVSKAYLSKMTGADERIVRAAIKRENAELAKKGIAIVSTASHKGYWKTDDVQELEAYEAEQMHRALKIMENLRPVKSLIKAHYEQGQVTIDAK